MVKRPSGKLELIMTSHALIHMFQLSLLAMLPLMRSEFNLSYAQIGTFTFGLALITASGSVPMGFVSDQVRRLRLLAFTFLIVGILGGLLVLAMSLFWVIVVFVFLWMCLTVFHPAAQGYLSVNYRGKLGATFGLYEAGASLGMTAAPIVAVWTASLWGWRSVYGVLAPAAFLVALAMYRTAARGSSSRPRTKRGLLAEFRRSIKTVVTHRRLRFIFLVHGLFAFGFAAATVFLPIFAVDVHGFSVSQAGYLLSLLLLPGLFGKILGGRLSDRWARNRVMGCSFLVLAPLLVVLSLTTGWISLIVVTSGTGFVIGMIAPVTVAFAGESVKKDIGVTYGLQSSVGFAFGGTRASHSGITGGDLGTPGCVLAGGGDGHPGWSVEFVFA